MWAVLKSVWFTLKYVKMSTYLFIYSKGYLFQLSRLCFLSFLNNFKACQIFQVYFMLELVVLVRIYIFQIFLFYFLRDFHISVGWWFFTGVWATASLLNSPGLFWVFWPNVNNALVWTVSTNPVISKSSSLFTNPLVTVPRAPIKIAIIDNYMWHSFFQFPSKVEILIHLFQFFKFYSVAHWDSKIHNSASSHFFGRLL